MIYNCRRVYQVGGLSYPVQKIYATGVSLSQELSGSKKMRAPQFEVVIDMQSTRKNIVASEPDINRCQDTTYNTALGFAS